MKDLFGTVLFWIYFKMLGLRIRNTLPFFMASHFFNYTDAERAIMMAMGFANAAKTGGDYLEFGSYEGGSAVAAYHFSRQTGNTGMRLYCFDSFEGLPEIRGIDDMPAAFFKKGEYRCDRARFERILRRRGVDMRHVTVVPGWYEQTLTEETKKRLPLKKASVILIDCDLHSSAASALNFVTGYVQDGTVIIFDDWFNFAGNPERGEQKAFAEWLARNPQITATEYHKVGWSINSFILHKRPGA